MTKSTLTTSACANHTPSHGWTGAIASLRQEKGLWVAIAIITLWMVSTIGLFSLNFATLALPWRGLAFLWQVFLYTGLFVTAHDAMHGSVTPAHRRWNDAIGTLALWLYGLFDYTYMRQQHQKHHAQPAQKGDPDYHAPHSSSFLAWYGNFMGSYWSWLRLGLLISSFHAVHQIFQISEANLSWFWVFPAITSSLQLFFFGTYLPHREPRAGYTNDHRSQSTDLPVFWSFLTCYHFGYHEEHHALPHLAWWQLPQVRGGRGRGGEGEKEGCIPL
ncbi:MAG: fatty acid desaturase [Synechococcales bacterium]|nr:fatty acid desaturase [Synechococcales bacterium]